MKWISYKIEKEGMMGLTEEQIDFIQAHLRDDVAGLLLSAKKYPGLDVPFLADQIVARRQIREKLPSWYANQALVFPSRLSAEQCSSELAAAYKQRLIESGQTVCDLTGGLGVDSFFLSRKAGRLMYIERFPAYCEAARNNFFQLGASNVEVMEGESPAMLAELPPVDVFYIDPARRGEGNRKVYALEDCEPDLCRLLPQLLEKAPRVVAKLSPMADIHHTLTLLSGTKEVHVVSVKNECKEVVFVIDRSIPVSYDPLICCVNLKAEGEESVFSYHLSEEAETTVSYADEVSSYLYEPNASVLKAGAFKRMAAAYGVSKLQASSHLYTSTDEIKDFPGRIFQVDEVIPFSSSVCRTLTRKCPQANITTRNFPLTVEALRKKTKITDGGSVYLFATLLQNGDKVLIRCRKAGLSD